MNGLHTVYLHNTYSSTTFADFAEKYGYDTVYFEHQEDYTTDLIFFKNEVELYRVFSEYWHFVGDEEYVVMQVSSDFFNNK